MTFGDFVSAAAGSMGRGQSTASYEYEARQRRKANRIITIHDEDNNKDIEININDIFNMYISNDRKYLIKYKKLGMIRVNNYDYSEIRKRMDERFANIYDIDRRRVMVINTNGITSMNHDEELNKYTITVGIKNTVYNIPYEYYHAIAGLTNRRKKTFKEILFGVEMPHWSQIEEKHRSEDDEKKSKSEWQRKQDEMQKELDEIARTTPAIEGWLVCS